MFSSYVLSKIGAWQIAAKGGNIDNCSFLLIDHGRQQLVTEDGGCRDVHGDHVLHNLTLKLQEGHEVRTKYANVVNKNTNINSGFSYFLHYFVQHLYIGEVCNNYHGLHIVLLENVLLQHLKLLPTPTDENHVHPLLSQPYGILSPYPSSTPSNHRPLSKLFHKIFFPENSSKPGQHIGPPARVDIPQPQ